MQFWPVKCLYLSIAQMHGFLRKLLFNLTVNSLSLTRKMRLKFSSNFLNPFLTNVPLLYPIKTSENPRFQGWGVGVEWVGEHRNGTLVENGSSKNISLFTFISVISTCLRIFWEYLYFASHNNEEYCCSWINQRVFFFQQSPGYIMDYCQFRIPQIFYHLLDILAILKLKRQC